MSRDPETAHAYAADPLVYSGSYKRPLLEAEVAALDRFNAELDRITMPVLFLHGEADPLAGGDIGQLHPGQQHGWRRISGPDGHLAQQGGLLGFGRCPARGAAQESQ